MKNKYIIFDEYKTESVGIWFFVPIDGEYKNGTPSKGFGCIKYSEGSVYIGDIYYDGKFFNKLGHGRQDFTRSNIGEIVTEINERKYKYVGRYDYRKTDWIHGNGVLYYTDALGNPTHFRKGFFAGLRKIADYKGEFDYTSLIDGYTADMEFDYDELNAFVENRLRDIKSKFDVAGKTDVLFIGDSYFELMDNAAFAGKHIFGNEFPNDYVNAGVCGSMFSDWIDWLDKLEGISAPDKILINLGLNDIHSGKSAKRTYGDFKTLLRLLREIFPKAEYSLVSVVQTPDSLHLMNTVNEYNEMILRNAKRNGVSVGGWYDRIVQSKLNCFHTDDLHPNEFGYGLFIQFIKEFLKGNSNEN